MKCFICAPKWPKLLVSDDKKPPRIQNGFENGQVHGSYKHGGSIASLLYSLKAI